MRSSSGWPEGRRSRGEPNRMAAALAMLALSGCVVARLGAGATAGVDSSWRPITVDSEVGLALPLDRQGTVIGSVLAVGRNQTTRGGPPLVGLEAAVPLGDGGTVPRAGSGEAAPREGPTTLLGGRLEAGRDDRGRYVGGALVARRLFAPWGMIMPSVEVVVAAGSYLEGPGRPVVGAHVLVGIF